MTTHTLHHHQLRDTIQTKLRQQAAATSAEERLTSANSIFAILASSDAVDFLKKYIKFRNVVKYKCDDLVTSIENHHYLTRYPPITTRLLCNIDIVHTTIQNIENDTGYESENDGEVVGHVSDEDQCPNF